MWVRGGAFVRLCVRTCRQMGVCTCARVQGWKECKRLKVGEVLRDVSGSLCAGVFILSFFSQFFVVRYFQTEV